MVLSHIRQYCDPSVTYIFWCIYIYIYIYIPKTVCNKRVTILVLSFVIFQAIVKLFEEFASMHTKQWSQVEIGNEKKMLTETVNFHMQPRSHAVVRAYWSVYSTRPIFIAFCDVENAILNSQTEAFIRSCIFRNWSQLSLKIYIFPTLVFTTPHFNFHLLTTSINANYYLLMYTNAQILL